MIYRSTNLSPRDGFSEGRHRQAVFDNNVDTFAAQTNDQDVDDRHTGSSALGVRVQLARDCHVISHAHVVDHARNISTKPLAPAKQNLDPRARHRDYWRGQGLYEEEEEPLLDGNMAQRDERYEIEQRMDHVTNESLDATKRIRAVAEETNQIGVDTLVTLNEQGEQLDNVERRLDEINVDLKQTDRNLTKIEQCCGCCTCLCTRPRSMEKSKHYKKVYGKKARQMENVVQDEPTRSGNGRGQPQGPFVKRVTDDVREDEMEDNLQ